ncbi:MAG: hypothetical protein AAGD14_09685 [Planctomycetota bacterium]
MNRPLVTILFASFLVAFGVLAGWFGARQSVQEEAAGTDDAPPELSDRTLANLGVTVGPAELSAFVRTVQVQATVQDAPNNEEPLVALLGGVVTKLHTRSGAIVRTGDPIVSIARAPIPRPELKLIADIVAPVGDELQDAARRLQQAEAEARIARRERDRLRAFAEPEGAPPVIAKKELIQQRYEVERKEQAVRGVEAELTFFGLSASEIAAVRGGAVPPPGVALWRRALTRNGLWGEREDALLAALPGKLRGRPWTTAVIGELSAAGLLTDAVVTAVREEPKLARRFIDAAALLLRGHSPDHVLMLARTGTLDPTTTLVAPEGDWDVAEMPVDPGERVEAGRPVALLYDARSMWLRLEPIGREIGPVTQAFERGVPLRARPLVEGSGPALESVRIDRLATRAAEHERGARAFAIVPNGALPHPDGTTRTWQLRVGLRYLLEVPIAEPVRSFVLPAGALTTEGSRQLVYVRDGKTFRDVEVLVTYVDDQIAVIANDGSLFEGDPVARSGAFALGLALQEDTGAAGHAHHGHSH